MTRAPADDPTRLDLGSSTRSSGRIAAGQRFASRYTIIRPLGEGGMGAVYQAWDETLGVPVALKTIRVDPARRPAIARDLEERFKRELRLARQVTHPNVVRIHDLGEVGTTKYITMAYVQGQDLGTVLHREGRLPVARALSIARQIAAGLAAAHEAGVVHRDLKPANVLIDSEARALLTDFGIARAVDAVTAHTMPGAVVGTLAYMSPEQARGDTADTRSDVYSFGLIVYEMLAGGRPGGAGEGVIGELLGRLQQGPTALRIVAPDTPPPITRVVERCLQPNPAARYQDAGELSADLNQLRPDGTLALRPAPARRATAVVVPAATILALATLAVSSWLFYPRGRATSSHALEVRPLTTDVGDEESPSFSPDGQQVAYSWNGEGRDNYDIYVRLIGNPRPLRLTTDPARDLEPAFSPDGRSIGFVRVASDRWSYVVIPVIGGSERVITRLPQEVVDPTTTYGSRWSSVWLPGGTAIVLDGLRRLSIETGELTEVTDGSGVPVVGWYPAVAPNGRALAFARPSGLATSGLYLLELAERGRFRGEPRLLATVEGDAWGLTWTGDSRELVFSTGRLSGTSGVSKTLWRVAITGAEPEPVAVGDDATSPALSRDGNRLAFVRNTLDVNIWRAPLPADGDPAAAAAIFAPSTRNEWNPQYSPDGRRVAFESTRTGESAIWVGAADGSNLVEVFSRAGRHSGTPRWSPDGQRLAFDSSAEGNFDVYVIDLDTVRPVRVTTDAADDAMPSWSPDGQWIYFSSTRTGRQEVWRVPVGGGAAVQITRQGGACVYPSADGARIYYTKHDGDAALWTMPVEGGDEEQVLPSVIHRNFVVFADGIYFIAGAGPDGRFGVHHLSFATGAVELVAPLAADPSLGLSVAPDRRHVLYVQSDRVGRDLMLVEGFR